MTRALWAWRCARAVTCFAFALVGTCGGLVQTMVWLDQPETAAECADDPAIAELVKRGWIPAGLIPPQAGHIRELHDLDTNDVWLRFRGTDGLDLSGFSIATSGIAAFEDGRCDKPSWWHPDLVDACRDRYLSEGWRVYEQPGAWLAVHLETGDVFYRR